MNEFNLLYPQGTAPGFQKISEPRGDPLPQ